MSTLYTSLIQQAVQKQQKLASRFLRSIQKGTFPALSSQEKWRRIKRLRRLEKRLNLGSVRELKHWTVAAALGFVTFTAAAQQEQAGFPAKDKQRQERLAGKKALSHSYRSQNKAWSVEELSFTAGPAIGDGPIQSFVHADVDGDGDADIIKFGYYTRGQVYLNAGNGTYQKGPMLPADLPAFEDMLPGDLDGDSDLDLFLTQYEGSPMLLLNGGGGEFTASTLTQFTSAGKAALADFDGDGDLDAYLVSTEDGAEKGVLALNNASGQFSASGQAITLQTLFYDLLAADMNGDNRPDLIISTGAPEIVVLLNEGQGQFAEGAVAVADHTIFRDLQLADMNGDAYPDLVGLTEEEVVVYINQQGESLTLASHLPHQEGRVDFSAMGLGDTDADGDTDLVFAPFYADNTGEGSLAIFSNNGSGVLAAAQGDVAGIAAAEGPWLDIKVLDTDGDGLEDIVYTNFLSFGFLKQGVDGAFSVGTNNLPLAISAGTEMLAEDFDQDGDADILSNGLPLVWLKQQNSFTPREIPMPSGELLYDINAPDIDGDGDKDLVLTTYGSRKAFVYVNDGTAQFSLQQELLIPHEQGSIQQRGIKTGDIDGDGDQDIISEALYSHSWIEDGVMHSTSKFGFAVWINNGQGDFSLTKDFDSTGTANNYQLLDVNGDARAELVGVAGDKLDVLSVDAAGNLSPLSEYTSGSEDANYRWLSTADIDSDGDQDMLISDEEGFIEILANDGAGNFSQLSRFAASEYARVAAGDLDKDGDMDIVSQSPYDGTLFWLNDGNETFSQAGSLPSSWGTSKVMLSDVDKDGDLDILTNGYYSQASIWYNQLLASPNSLEDVRTAGIRLHPNPSQGSFSIDWQEQPKGGVWKVEVLNLSGQSIHQQQLVAGDASELNISPLPAGLYLLRLSNGSNSYMHRIVKQ